MLVLADLEGCSYQSVFGADYNIKGGYGKGPGRGKRGLQGNAWPSWALPGNVRPIRGVVHTPSLREATSCQAVMLPNPHNNMAIRSLEGILSAAVIHVTLHGRVSNGQITILKVVMERVPAVASVGSKGTPGQAVALPGNVRPSRGVVHTPRKREATSGQAVMLPKPHNNMEIRSLEGILSAAVIRVTLHGRVSNGDPERCSYQLVFGSRF